MEKRTHWLEPAKQGNIYFVSFLDPIRFIVTQRREETPEKFRSDSRCGH